MRIQPLGTWLLSLGAILLVATHAGILYYASSHTSASLAVIGGMVILIAIEHSGLLGPLFLLFRRSQ